MTSKEATVCSKTVLTLYNDSCGFYLLLERLGFNVVDLATAEEAKKQLVNRDVALLVICSVRAMDTPVGVFAPLVKAEYPHLPIILVTGDLRMAFGVHTVPGVDYTHSKFDSWDNLMEKIAHIADISPKEKPH